jgi:branched-chain amino acid transport system permease protein
MSFWLIQCLNGLSHASTLFMMAAGLTLVFGVTRIVNFAHGSFYMLGALLAGTWVTQWHPVWAEQGATYFMAMLMGASCAALLGALTEYLLFRPLRHSPPLYPLVATFGLGLFLHDVLLFLLGPNEVFAPRFPGLKGAVPIGEDFFPQWQLLMLLAGPLVWWLLHALLTKTKWGQQVRAATQDREMLDALGINPAPLMLGVVVLGCGLAGLAGALQLPREPANLQMDLQVVVETFVVVVMGGLGSIAGAFFASVLIGCVHAFGIYFFPQATLILIFLTMALVLAIRPQGLMGELPGAAQREKVLSFNLGMRSQTLQWAVWTFFIVLALGVMASGDYAQSVLEDVLIMLLFGLSLQWTMSLSGWVSFGHAAYFGLGAYAAALSHVHWHFSALLAALMGIFVSVLAAALMVRLLKRSSGVYLAMLSLAFAQVVWASASQWVSVTGGDNGLIGLNFMAQTPRWIFQILLLALCGLSMYAFRRLVLSSLGAALQAGRDAPQRAMASGLRVGQLNAQVFLLSAGLAGLAGSLWAISKGAVFPSVASISQSVDALMVVLLGGVHHLWASVAGSVFLVGIGAEMARHFEYWRGFLGLIIMMLMVYAPEGVLGRGLMKRNTPKSVPKSVKESEITPVQKGSA